MGFGTRDSATYFGTFEGSFTRKCREGDEGAVARTKKSGEVVYEQRYDYVEGKIVDIKKDTFEWQGKKVRQLKIHLMDSDGTYVLSFPIDSSAALSFYAQAENINLKDSVRVFIMLSDDRQRLLFHQPTAKSATEKGFVRSLYNKENPSPQWEKMTVNGETVWDKTESLNFFWNKIENNVLPSLLEVAMEAPTEIPTKVPSGDDLPF